MNDFELFAQVVFALRFVDVLAYFFADRSCKSEHFVLFLQVARKQGKAFGDGRLFEQRLFGVVFQVCEMRAQIDEQFGVVHAFERRFEILASLHAVFDEFLGVFLRDAQICLFNLAFVVNAFGSFEHGDERVALHIKTEYAGAVKPRVINAQLIAGQARRLADPRHRAYGADVAAGGGIVLGTVLPREEHQVPVLFRLFHGGDRKPSADVEHARRVGEYDLRTHGYDGERRLFVDGLHFAVAPSYLEKFGFSSIISHQNRTFNRFFVKITWNRGFADDMPIFACLQKNFHLRAKKSCQRAGGYGIIRKL